jgi:hypothetical protein
MIDLSIS